MKEMCSDELETQIRTIETYRKILALSKSNFEVDLTSYYKKLIAL